MTRREPNNGCSNRSSNSVFYQLVNRMQSLSFVPFQMCVMLWLGKKGLRSIRPLGRIHRRGRRSSSGADFLAKLKDSEVDVAIQVRHWRTPMQRRAVDEFWGFMLRNDVPLGVIVCGSTVMKSALKAAAEYPGRPIELVSCDRLCSSMAALELGVVEQQGRWVIDEGFFRSLHELGFASLMSVALEDEPRSTVVRDRNSEQDFNDSVDLIRWRSRRWRKMVLLVLLVAIMVLVAACLVFGGQP
jgi:hypothetical protein